MIATLPHAEWQETHEEADRFADSIKQFIELQLEKLQQSKRLIYCQHLANLGGQYSFEVEAADHDSEINEETGHRNDCACEHCRVTLGLAF